MATHQPLPLPWLALLPGRWAFGGALLLFVVSIAILFWALRLPGGGPSFSIRGMAVAAMLWWPLMGARLCQLAYDLVPLRLPGLPRLLLAGALLHGAVLVVLPVLALALVLALSGAFDAGVLAGMAAALWAGAATGALVMSLPLAGVLLPVLLPWWLIGSGALLRPAEATLLGLAAWALAALAWRWQLARPRRGVWQPFGLTFDGLALPWRLAAPRGWREAPAVRAEASDALDAAEAPEVAAAAPSGVSRLRRERLAWVLGPSCQTLRQMFGPRGRWGFYLVAALGCAVAAWLVPWLTGEPRNRRDLFLPMASVAVLVMLGQQPARGVVALLRSRPAALAELLLAPGFPPRQQLPRLVWRQAALALGEKLLLLGLCLPVLMTATQVLSGAWLLWWAGFVALLWIAGSCAAALAWQGVRWPWPVRGGLALGVMGLGIASSVLLLRSGGLPAPWLVAWAVVALLVLGVAVLTRRRLEVGGSAAAAPP